MAGRHDIDKPDESFWTIPEVIKAARQRLSPAMWDIATGGAASETTMRRNRLAMEETAFRPRILRGVSEPDLSAAVFGRRLASPVMLAPIGSLALFDAGGASVSASAAAGRGALALIGILANPSLTEVAAASPNGHNVLQIYIRGDDAWLDSLVGSAQDAGYAGLCLTVDSTGGSGRQRELHNRYVRAIPPSPNLPSDPDGAGRARGLAYQRAFTWKDFDRLRTRTTLPIAIKGILCGEDAGLAVEHGADVVYVSNHGGRELDHLPATINVLPEVVEVVAGRAQVLVDGGFLRGPEIVKALALGADAVGLGRLQVLAIAAGGAALLRHTLALLDAEIRDTLTLLGVTRLGDLTVDHVRAVAPVGYRATYLTELTDTNFPAL